MIYSHTTLNVKDMAESLKFYEEIVGLKINRKMDAGAGMQIVFLGGGETKIELIYNPSNKDIEMGKDISLGFAVESADKMMAFVKEKNIAIHSGPFEPNPHVKFFYVLDPNGLKIQFIESH